MTVLVDFLFFSLLIGLTRPHAHLPMALNVIPEDLGITCIRFMTLCSFHRTVVSFAGDKRGILIMTRVLKIVSKISDSLNDDTNHFGKMGRNKVNALMETDFITAGLLNVFCVGKTYFLDSYDSPNSSIMSTHITRIPHIPQIPRDSKAARGKQETHLLHWRSRTSWAQKQEKDFINRVVIYMSLRHRDYAAANLFPQVYGQYRFSPVL